MITVTETANDQIEISRSEANLPDLPLRIEIQVQKDGSFHYIMGFDDNINAGDSKVEGSNIIYNEASKPLIEGMTLDFVELDGKNQFIFLNPNDPNYRAPV